MRWQRVMSLGLCLVAIWGCSPNFTPSNPQAEAALVAKVAQETYQLGPEDAIEISVWKEPELTKQLIVRPDGKITYPLVGEIQAAGRNVKQLQEEVAKSLTKYVTDANVTVILLKTQYYKIYVTGKVNKPGDFVLGRPTDVIQAIAMAGGLTPFASPKSIVVLRRVGGTDVIYPFNYNDVSKGKSLEQNRTLLPGDVVVVP
ncbi:MAG: polysaccharide biosynthesis/export family protein [Deltaproteobacteria bacterium]|nr:polysaccharide biosynthesis/export family protein [Deltaproteobacteria bacterium]